MCILEDSGNPAFLAVVTFWRSFIIVSFGGMNAFLYPELLLSVLFFVYVLSASNNKRSGLPLAVRGKVLSYRELAPDESESS